MFRYSRQDNPGTLVQTTGTDLVAFGHRLQRLRRRAGFSQRQVAEALELLAQAGPAGEYRVVDDTLISRWEGARTHKGRRWRPTRPYALHLIRLFANLLDEESAHTWAIEAGYQLSPAELEPPFLDLSEATRVQVAEAQHRLAGRQGANARMVALDPDVAAAFPTSEAVNHALRLVMQLALIPERKAAYTTKPLAAK